MKTIKAQMLLKHALLFVSIFSIVTFFSCSKDDEDPVEDPIASFQYEVDDENYLQVSFMNYSQNAESYSWAFGDGQTSSEENPLHTYAEEGNYEVVLTAFNSEGVSRTFSQSIEIKDPFVALAMLAGTTSKTWKLYRVDEAMGIGPTTESPYEWWALRNDGSRPCVYEHEFIFHRDGTYEFKDNGVFWGEGIAEPYRNTCFEPTTANMVNEDGDDVSAWMSGTHSFEYNPSNGTVTIMGEGAWIGLPKTGTDGYVDVPQQSVSFNVKITEHTGYDLMEVVIIYPGDEDNVWQFNYASYSDPSLEPELVTEVDEEPDLDSVTPTELGHTFETTESFDLLGELGGTSVITPGVDDPADATATKVGRFERTDASYQEAQLRVSPEPMNIQFDNFTTVSIDVYMPSDNTYDPLTKKVIIGFGDLHTTTEWWNNLIQYESEELALDQWVTVTFDLDSPSFASNDDTPFDRTDLDMVYIQIGGGAHSSTGEFFIRNLIFE